MGQKALEMRDRFDDITGVCRHSVQAMTVYTRPCPPMVAYAHHASWLTAIQATICCDAFLPVMLHLLVVLAVSDMT